MFLQLRLRVIRVEGEVLDRQLSTKVKQLRLFVFEQVEYKPRTFQLDEYHTIDVILGELFRAIELVDKTKVVSTLI